MKIGKICEFVYGGSLPKQDRKDGKIPVYGSNGQIDFHDKPLSTGETIIVGRKGSIGEVHYSYMDCWIIDTAYYIKPLINVNLRYLYHLLKSLNLSNLNKACAIPGLNRDDVYKIEVDLPLIDEQERIVKIIETKIKSVEKLKITNDKLIETSELLKISFFKQVYSEKSRHWVKMFFEDVFDTKTGKLNSNAMVENGEYPFFTCSKEVFKINEYAFDCEALLLAGNNAAGIYDVKHYKGKFNAYQRTYILTLKDSDYDYRLFKYFLEQKLKLLRDLSKGSNTRFLTIEILKTLEFLVPPKSEQAKIMNELAKKSKIIQKINHLITEQAAYIDALPSSILRQAFNGKL